MICIHCDVEFDARDKLRQAKQSRRPAGKVNECLDCASDGPDVYTGVMVYGHKTAGSIEIHSDPRLTAYLLAGSPSGGTRRAMGVTRPHVKDNSAVMVETDIARRR